MLWLKIDKIMVNFEIMSWPEMNVDCIIAHELPQIKDD